jgi:transposase-like protein
MVRKGYPAEFRRRVIELVEGGKKVAEVSRDLGISEQSIYTWRRQGRIDAGLEAGLTSTEKAELAAAKKRILELQHVTQRRQRTDPRDLSKRSRLRIALLAQSFDLPVVAADPSAELNDRLEHRGQGLLQLLGQMRRCLATKAGCRTSR